MFIPYGSYLESNTLLTSVLSIFNVFFVFVKTSFVNLKFPKFMFFPLILKLDEKKFSIIIWVSKKRSHVP